MLRGGILIAAKVTINIDSPRVAARIKSGVGRMIPAVAEQALADCNYFARRDQGTLIQSSETASDLQRGELVWDTPYAKRVYYTGTPSKDENPNASLMWCEKAKSTDGADWQKIAQKQFEEGMRA